MNVYIVCEEDDNGKELEAVYASRAEAEALANEENSEHIGQQREWYVYEFEVL